VVEVEGKRRSREFDAIGNDTGRQSGGTRLDKQPVDVEPRFVRKRR
jgi:hypothetical protein